MTVAAAQTVPLKGDISANVAAHIQFIEKAAQSDTDIIVFPELSLTGYELEMAKDCAISEQDNRLVPFKTLSEKCNMTIIAGAPVLNKVNKPHLGALVFSPGQDTLVYAKQFLHEGEAPFFEPGHDNLVLTIGNNKIGMAICADITHPEHPEGLAGSDLFLYSASVLMSDNGYDLETSLLKSYAKKYDMAVLMANYGGPTGGWISAGKSIIFNEKGDVVVASPGLGCELVIAVKIKGQWSGKVVQV